MLCLYLVLFLASIRRFPPFFPKGQRYCKCEDALFRSTAEERKGINCVLPPGRRNCCLVFDLYAMYAFTENRGKTKKKKKKGGRRKKKNTSNEVIKTYIKKSPTQGCSLLWFLCFSMPFLVY